MTQTEPSKMHERLTALEANHKNVISRIDNVENSVAHLSDKIDKVLDYVQDAKVRQLPPIQTILVTAVATCTLISMLVYGLYWIIDTRVGYGVSRANTFTSQLADGSENIWVKFHDYDTRLKRLESSSKN